MARRAHLDAAEGLLSRIVAGEFSPGQLLPKEQAVADQYEMQRGTAREALRALEERHVAIVKHGRGATVQEPSTWNVLDPMVAAALLAARGRTRFLGEIEEARAFVEPELAALAAERANPADHKALAEALSEGSPADAFDLVLARIADNRPLATVAAALRRLVAPSPAPAKARRAVLAAVTAGDADAAHAAMYRALSAKSTG